MLLAFGSSPSHAAQIAASIEYDIVTRPSGLPDNFQPGTGNIPEISGDQGNRWVSA